MPTPLLRPWYNSTKGEWYVRVRYRDGLAPAETRHALGEPDRERVDAQIDRFRAETLPALLAGRTAPEQAPDGKLHHAVTWYIVTYLPHVERAAKTIDAYDRVLHDFLSFCRARHVGRVAQISSRVVQEWQAERSARHGAAGGQGGTAKRDEMLILRRFFAVTADHRELPELDIQWDIPGKRRSRRFRALDAGELAAVRAALDADAPKPALLIRWMLLTPWLPSDVIDLRVGEDKGDYIDRDRIKTSRQMLYPVTLAMREVIAQATAGRAPKRAEHVFLTRAGEPWTYFELEKQTRYWQKRHGLDFTFRDLRVTFASNLAAAGCPAPHLAELMGHEDVATTYQYYVRVDQSTLRDWAARATQPAAR